METARPFFIGSEVMSNSNHKELLGFCGRHNVKLTIEKDWISFKAYDECGLLWYQGSVMDDDHEKACAHLLRNLKAIYAIKEDGNWEEKFKVLADKHDVQFTCNHALTFSDINIWKRRPDTLEFEFNKYFNSYKEAFKWLMGCYGVQIEIEVKVVEPSWEEKLKAHNVPHCLVHLTDQEQKAYGHKPYRLIVWNDTGWFRTEHNFDGCSSEECYERAYKNWIANGYIKEEKPEELSWEDKFKAHDIPHSLGLISEATQTLSSTKPFELIISWGFARYSYDGWTKEDCFKKAYKDCIAKGLIKESQASSREQKLRDYCEEHDFKLDIKNDFLSICAGEIWVNDVHVRNFRTEKSKEIACRLVLDWIKSYAHTYLCEGC